MAGLPALLKARVKLLWCHLCRAWTKSVIGAIACSDVTAASEFLHRMGKGAMTVCHALYFGLFVRNEVNPE